MGKSSVYKLFFTIIIWLPLLFDIVPFFLFARGAVITSSELSVPEAASSRNRTNPEISVININNMAYWVNKDGSHPGNYGSINRQAIYPIFTGGLIYNDGMVWGVKANEYPESAPVRVGGSTYNTGMKAGRVIYNQDGTVAGADDPENNHIWRVRRDYVTGDLSVDVANFYGTSVDDITGAQIQAVFDQYAYDWNNWPATWGAPYDDVDGNGSYDPNVDIPGYPGADQTLWTISNDLPTIVDENGNPTGVISNTSPQLYGANPVGVEFQLTMWAYKLESDKPLGNAVYKRTQLTYTGFEATSEFINPEVLDTVYFTQWSDPDLGTAEDDFVGCDIDLSLGFVYNGDETDGEFNGVYDMPAPAGGYDFLKSPEDENGIELGMTAFTYFGNLASITDPDLGIYSGSLQFFNLMEGFLPRPEYPVQIPFTNPSTGEETKFALSGDPATGQGWIDGIDLPPGDRRLVMSSGPFSMSKGESQEIIVALIGAQRINPIESLRKLKKDDEIIQLAYDTEFNLLDYRVNVYPEIESEIGTVCSLSVDVSNVVATVYATLDNGSGSVVDLVLNSSNNYFIQTELAESPNPYTLSLVLYLSTGASYSLDNLAKQATAWDPIIMSDDQVIYDNLSNDGALNIGDLAHIALTITNSSDHEIEELVAMVLNVDGPIDYYEDPYLSFGNIIPYGNGSSSIFTDDHGYVKIKVSESAQEGDTLVVAMRFFDLLGNIWEEEYELYIQGNEGMTDLTGPDHIEGSAAGNFAYRVVRPDDVTGHEYQISFSEYTPGSLIRSAGKIMDCSGSTVIGYATNSSTPGTIDLLFEFNMVCPGGDWVDGIGYTFPDGFSSNVNDWAFTDGNICSYGSSLEGYVQDCDNLDGTWTGDVLLFGNDNGSGFGAFESSNVLTINVDPWFTYAFFPLTIGYVIYDDGYDENLVNAEGEFTVNDYWEYPPSTVLMNIHDVNTGQLILTTDIYPNEEGTNIDIIDGFKLFKGSVSYDATEDFNQIIDWFDPPCWDPANRPCFQEWVDGSYDIGSYMQAGWAATARAIDTWGAGATSTSLLGRDVQIRFTGVYETEPTFVNGVYYIPVQEGTGSSAWIDGARQYDIALHPDPNNPGTGEPFRLQIPFEVWDMEALDGPRQIDITIYDRVQQMNEGDTVYAFNPYDRMYTHFIMEDHATSDAAASFSEDSLTWNVVWWITDFIQGDVLTFEYLSPVSVEDRYLFTPATGTFRHISDVIPDGYNLVQNYPNPFNPTTKIDYGLPEASNVRLIIYDILGREVTTLVNGVQEPGYKSITWNGKNTFGNNVGAGMYFYQLKAGEFMQVKKMVLLK
jgi:hypothetical protein